MVPAGRRSGKTEIAKRRLVWKALRGNADANGRYFAGAPTRDQAKRIFWADLKAMVPPHLMAGRPSETELSIATITGSILTVVGMDKPERIEGTPWDYGVLDEYGNMKPEAWGQNIRPALSDRTGGCDFIGVPEGRNHYYDLAEDAQAQAQLDSEEWAYFHWISADILPESEIAAARRDLDELTFQQEYEASFVDFAGRAYYAFSAATHCAPLEYFPRDPLIFCFDFNTAPGVAAVVQEQKLPGGEVGTGIIGDVLIPQNSTTPAVCQKLIADWGEHPGKVVCYGDATGGAGGSAKVRGSDWDLIREELAPVFGGRLSFNVPPGNPRERVRINAVNSRLKSVDGDIRMMIDRTKAPSVVKDFEGVRLLEGGSGQIDKKSDLKLSHVSDACGYYIAKQFPVTERVITSHKFG